jgi:formate dehydrogenase subunit delta
MDIEHMVKMVNEISLFYEGESGVGAESVQNVANHLRRFWDPRMRTQIVAHYEHGAHGLEDVARAAVGLLASGETKPATVQNVGGEGSDAG